jgi:hypothetical protein
MSQEGVLSVDTSGAPVVETLSSEGGPDTPPNGHNFNFSGSIAGGSAANGAIEFITPGGPGHNEDGQMDAVVLTDGTTIGINASNELYVIGGVFTEAFEVDAHTAPGTNPVEPNGAGLVTVTGGQVAAGTTANVIRTDSLAANTYTIQVQRSQAVASSTVGDNGVSHFNSADFTVDANGFVTFVGAIGAETITGNSGGALSPTAGNFNIFGAAVAAGTTPVTTVGSGSTLTVDVQTSQAISSTNASNIGLSAFNSADFTVDANGFVSSLTSSTFTTITHASSPYTVLSTDQFISADVTGGVITVKLPNTTTTGRIIRIKDKVGLSNTSNISITTVGGTVTIDGQTTYSMFVNYESISLIFDGTNYEVF